MDLCEDYAQDSDDDVFFGELTIKEIKRHIFVSKYRQTMSCNIKEYDDKLDTSVKIIEVHSTPNILNYDEETPLVPNQVRSNPDLFLEATSGTSNPKDSCANTEMLISALVLSPKQDHKTTKSPETFKTNLELSNSDDFPKEKSPRNLEVKHEFNLQEYLKPVTPTKQINNNIKETDQTQSNPLTPDNSSTFKTPGKPVSHKKNPVTPKNKTKFQNIISPVAYYIKNSPVPSLVTNVHPKKPIQTSSIPKLIKSTPSTSKGSKGNKENINLPQVAYKSAKETKMINLPHHEQKLPISQWSKKVASSIPKAIVIQHKHRENHKTIKRENQHDNSINDLTLHQADLSVCTQKTAFH